MTSDARRSSGREDGPPRDGPFAYVWEYVVRPDADGEFRRHYGPEGSWVQLFRRAAVYVGTQLYQDRDRPIRYLTVDSWETRRAFEDFRRQFRTEFERLDHLCETLTLRETPLGTFTNVRASNDG
jgi:hypothetical protein